MTQRDDAAVTGHGTRARPRARRRGARLLKIAVVLGFAALSMYTASGPLLTMLGRQLVHADPPERVDVMIVLASGVDRVIEAAQLYKAGYAPLVLLTTDPRDPSLEFLRSRGIHIETSEEVRQRILQGLGVPPASVLFLDEVVNSTADEARLFADWARQRPIRSVMIVTSPSHTARSRLTFRNALKDRQVKIVVRPSTLARFRPESWWKSRYTLREGIIEWQKLVYFALVELWRAPARP